MKHLKNINAANLLVGLVAISLSAPNVVMSGVGHGLTVCEVLASLLFPLGTYLLIMSIDRNSPRTALFFLPLMIICAFQIVVSVLYKDASPIGVDMFLNVVTTNSSEVGELLSGLMLPVVLVAVLYLSVILLSIRGLLLHEKVAVNIKNIAGRAGISIMAAGIVFVGISYLAVSSYDVRYDLFPVNAIENLVEAVKRQYKSVGSDEMSYTFTYNAFSGREGMPEVYIAVIGETSRADNWELLGYDRPTTPLLKQLGDSLVVFSSVFSESNTTHKSVPMLLTGVPAEKFGKNISGQKSIITAFKEAGFSTSFVSAQERNNSYIDSYAREADRAMYIPDRETRAYDQSVLPLVDSLLISHHDGKHLIVLHLYGSHYKYQDRYPKERRVFIPDENESDVSSKEVLINAYDNTIANTDYVLSELIGRLSRLDCCGALLYCSDHGEDLLDDERQRFLHASPVPSYWQLHVPLCLYTNKTYREHFPYVMDNAEKARNRIVSSSRSFAHTLLQMAGINTFYLNYRNSVVDGGFRSPTRLLFLNDRNKAVSLERAGFEKSDFDRLEDLSKPDSVGYVI